MAYYCRREGERKDTVAFNKVGLARYRSHINQALELPSDLKLAEIK
jgi:hypothetical protein